MRLPVVEPRRGRIRAGLAAVLALSLQTTAWALPEDSRQPIRITADHATMDEGRGEAAYRGSVRITQGTLDVQGDTLTLKVDKEGALTTARTLGKPARYQQKTDPAKGPVVATADEILFDNVNSTVTLIGNAVLRQDAASFTGPRIVYSVARKQIEASGNGSQRVELVFPPQQREAGKPKANTGSSK